MSQKETKEKTLEGFNKPISLNTIPWLRHLSKELAIIPPRYLKLLDKPINKGEEIIGEVPENLKVLWFIVVGLKITAKEKDSKRLREIESKEPNAERIKDLLEQFRWYTQESQAVLTIFLISLRHALNRYTGNIDIRKDWKVVTWKCVVTDEIQTSV